MPQSVAVSGPKNYPIIIIGVFSKLKRKVSPKLKAKNFPQIILIAEKSAVTARILVFFRLFGCNKFLSIKIPSLFKLQAGQ